MGNLKVNGKANKFKEEIGREPLKISVKFKVVTALVIKTYLLEYNAV
jgi:hypothetical protein